MEQLNIAPQAERPSYMKEIRDFKVKGYFLADIEMEGTLRPMITNYNKVNPGTLIKASRVKVKGVKCLKVWRDK